MKISKTFRINTEIFEMLVKQAKENKRSQASQIEFLIEQENNKKEAKESE